MSHPAIRDYFRAAAIGGDASDAALLERFASSRDEAAFELLVWRHAALVQRVCHGVLRDHHAAEDATQAAFLVLARKAHTVRGSVVGWLYRVSRRVALRLAKQRSRLPATAELDRIPATASEGVAADEVAALCDAVAELPERYRVPVLLCFFEGLTHAEAARRTGWPVGTVAGRLSRAKQLLARRLSRKGVGVAAVALAVPAGSFVGSTARAAGTFAARGPVVPGVESSVASLAEGVCKAMSFTVTKITALAAGLFVATATVWGVSQTGGATATPSKPLPATAAKPAVAAPLVAADRVADPKQRVRSVNNLKQILLAIHNYLSTHDHLPANITDKDGKALLSWRVLLLPGLNEHKLHQQFKLDEPWDSEHNKKFLAQMPEVFRCGFEPKGETKTHYQGFAGKGTVFEPGEKLQFANIVDGTSNTIGVVEAGPPVEWTRPADLVYDPAQAVRRDGPFKNVMATGMMDGAVVMLRPDLDDKTMHILIGRQDGLVRPDWKELTARLPLTADEVKVAQEILKANGKLIDAIGEQLREQQKLVVELGKLQNPKEAGRSLDLERLVQMQEGLESALEKLKKETAELQKEVKALKKE